MGGFFYNYEENAPGEHAHNQDLLHGTILDSVNFPDKYSDARLQCRKKFFTYNDAKSSERILKQILN